MGLHPPDYDQASNEGPKLPDYVPTMCKNCNLPVSRLLDTPWCRCVDEQIAESN